MNSNKVNDQFTKPVDGVETKNVSWSISVKNLFRQKILA